MICKVLLSFQEGCTAALTSVPACSDCVCRAFSFPTGENYLTCPILWWVDHFRQCQCRNFWTISITIILIFIFEWRDDSNAREEQQLTTTVLFATMANFPEISLGIRHLWNIFCGNHGVSPYAFSCLSFPRLTFHAFLFCSTRRHCLVRSSG